MQRQVYPLLACDKKNSEKANCKLADKVYRNDLRIYGQPKSYSLLKQRDGYVLVPNHKLGSQPHNNYINPENNIYSYVILQGENGNPLLKMTNGSHYYLANKAEYVIAAGDIHFKNNEIDKINDKSGTYPSRILDLSEDKREEYIETIQKLFIDLNLPFEKYKAHDPKKKNIANSLEKKPSCWPTFFTRDILIGTATTCVIAVAMYAYTS